MGLPRRSNREQAMGGARDVAPRAEDYAELP